MKPKVLQPRQKNENIIDNEVDKTIYTHINSILSMEKRKDQRKNKQLQGKTILDTSLHFRTWITSIKVGRTVLQIILLVGNDSWILKGDTNLLQNADELKYPIVFEPL